MVMAQLNTALAAVLPPTAADSAEEAPSLKRSVSFQSELVTEPAVEASSFGMENAVLAAKVTASDPCEQLFTCYP
jgi:hypothetical protein